MTRVVAIVARAVVTMGLKAAWAVERETVGMAVAPVELTAVVSSSRGFRRDTSLLDLLWL